MPVHVMRYGLLLFLSLTVVVGIQAVGTVLTNALLVVPVAAARLLTDRLGRMMALSCIFAVLSALGGVYVSYYFGTASGASIVMFCALIFAVAWVYKFIQEFMDQEEDRNALGIVMHVYTSGGTPGPGLAPKSA